jgi:hypothetical protein
MAAIPIVIKGTITTKAPKGGEVDESGVEQCIICGELGLPGLEIGGGPIYPPQVPPSEGKPPHPVFPIWGPPGIELPPGSGYPPVAGHPLPEPPEGGGEPGPIDGWEAKIGWTEETGWFVVIVPSEGTNVPTPSRRNR